MAKKNIEKGFERLVEIMARLRGPNGCPWDKEQTHRDINPYMLEEVHEVMEAIDRDDMEDLKEELGDLLLHITFHAQLAKEEGHFDIYDVIKGICEKLIYRHPHVFGGKKLKNSTDVVQRWEELKKAEGKKKSMLGGVPTELPALLKAFRLGEKAGRVGFDWTDADGILEKLQEEVRELNEARRARVSPSPLPLSPRGRGNKVTPQQAAGHHQIEHEYGDILFTLANIGRFLKINPEDALRKSSNRFTERFKLMEEEAAKSGLNISNLTLKEWDKLWKGAKSKNQDPKSKANPKSKVQKGKIYDKK